MPKPKIFHARAEANECEIRIDSLVGCNDTDEFGYTAFGVYARDIACCLAWCDAPTVRVTINSPGGVAAEGIAIYNLLRASGKKIVTECQGIAASAASIIFMAGDDRLMAEGTRLMLHNSSVDCLGEADELRETADALDKLDAGMAAIYSARSGKTVEECRTLMDAETYFGADEAVASGFATAKSGDAISSVAQTAMARAVARLNKKPKAISEPETKPKDAPMKDLIAALGLADDATPDQIQTAALAIIAAKKAQDAELEKLRAENDQFKKEADDGKDADAKAFADALVAAGAIKAEAHETFRALARRDRAEAEKVVAAINPTAKTFAFRPKADATGATGATDIDKLRAQANAERDPRKKAELARQIKALREGVSK